MGAFPTAGFIVIPSAMLQILARDMQTLWRSKHATIALYVDELARSSWRYWHERVIGGAIDRPQVVGRNKPIRRRTTRGDH